MLRRKNGRRTSSTAEARMPEFPDTKDEKEQRELLSRQMKKRWGNYDLAAFIERCEQKGKEYRESRGKVNQDKLAAIDRVAELYLYADANDKLDELLHRYRDQKGIIVRMDAHPLNAIIRATIVKSSGTAYGWAASIRLAIMEGAEVGKVGEYIKSHGGIDKCRRRFSSLMAKKQNGTAAIHRTPTLPRIAAKKVAVDAPTAAERRVALRIDKKPVKVKDEFRRSYRSIRARHENLFVRIRARVSPRGRLTLQSMVIDIKRTVMARAKLHRKGAETDKA